MVLLGPPSSNRGKTGVEGLGGRGRVELHEAQTPLSHQSVDAPGKPTRAHHRRCSLSHRPQTKCPRMGHREEGFLGARTPARHSGAHHIGGLLGTHLGVRWSQSMGQSVGVKMFQQEPRWSPCHITPGLFSLNICDIHICWDPCWHQGQQDRADRCQAWGGMEQIPVATAFLTVSQVSSSLGAQFPHLPCAP